LKNLKPDRTPRAALLASGGFTLLEVLLAIMILAITVTVLLQQFSVALRASTTAQEVTRGTLYAKLKLEELKMVEELTESAQSGTFADGYDWETRVVPYTHEAAVPEDEQIYDSMRVETFQLESTVKWRMGERTRAVTLTTLKTVRKKEWKQDNQFS
jgi:general secretion pathway protein I